MIRFEESTESDIPRIQSWIDQDKFHHGSGYPEWWLTGRSSFLSYRISDDTGPVLYARLDQDIQRDNGLVRLNCQFGPAGEITRLRFTKVLLQAVQQMINLAQARKATGVVYSSDNPELIRFMHRKFKFETRSDGDHELRFIEVKE